MCKGNPRDLPKGITPKTRTKNGKAIPVVTDDGTPVYRVRVWDAVLKKQIERTAEGLDAAKQLLEEFNEAKRRPGRLQAERVRFVDVATRYLVALQDQARRHPASQVVAGQRAVVPEHLRPPGSRQRLDR